MPDPASAVEKIWTVTATEDDCVLLVLEAGPPRPLTAAITGAELRSLVEPLRPVDEAVRRNEFSRSQLARICRDTIGRDPFDDAERWWQRRVGVVAELARLVLGAIGVASHHDGWLRLVAAAVAAEGLYRVAQRGWRRLRPTTPGPGRR